MFAFQWAASEALFWGWWLGQPRESSRPAGFIVTTILIGYAHFAIWYFFYFIRRMRIINPRVNPPRFRTALITTRVPSAEPLEIVQQTLLAMQAQDYPYPYEVWLADEDPDEETMEWCRSHNVNLCTRRDNPDYHNATWPRRARSKEGNLTYFYDHFGYDNYDVVFQFDADHVPTTHYVSQAIRAYAHPKIGYVAAPSICDKNAAGSWIARGRLYTEASMHGPYQLGLNGGFVPLCIGSHYSVRTSALKQIGGLGPELAEDFSTTFLLNAAGWQGAFCHTAIASGDGPQTFYDGMKQEFQWSRSLTNLLLTIVPPRLRHLPLRKRLQMAYAVLWYPSIATVSFIGYLLPVVAISFNLPIVRINYLAYLYILSTQTLIIIAAAYWLRNQGLYRPANAKILFWEAALYNLARWPWIVWGIMHSISDRFIGKEVIFKITPKSKDRRSSLALQHLTGYLALVVVPAVSVILHGGRREVAGYYYLALITSLMYISLIGVLLRRQYVEAQESWANLVPKIVVYGCLIGILGLAVSQSFRDVIYAFINIVKYRG